MVKDFVIGFSNSLEIHTLADPVPLNLDLLKPKSIGFGRLSNTTIVPSFKSFRLGVFVVSG